MINYLPKPLRSFSRGELYALGTILGTHFLPGELPVRYIVLFFIKIVAYLKAGISSLDLIGNAKGNVAECIQQHGEHPICFLVAKPV